MILFRGRSHHLRMSDVRNKATYYAVRKMMSENGFSDNQFFQQDFSKHPFLSSQVINTKKAIKK